ncbi:hypothetical protein SAMN04515691_0978 [Leifsonia sp. 98AMF]|uniref:hypothetical protein n=1 Tax=unclassified Leifsonia TaxID=2663824 RepID=UPI00087A1107|nr:MULTISPECIES: hypothetical protein [unclassified Leifsonia]SDH55554.1 hypothetical protein SAMN04515690_3042 [Leifsonia sp. 197AMF]SDI83219.1 hypothetical protein SAMN04515684_0746 [Leifsonia sp. 466MF]SDK00535.1 hypothetical protein SAMN04515683_2003 [Leifsonia sp. 157MF]SDN86441.1 hypothetical protein SAMN04515686_2948 [Leifsonia sp. 509MF]SEN20686.1 hypothetical protein SAMN04515685_2024 [Leifsonia sp. 467MF]
MAEFTKEDPGCGNPEGIDELMEQLLRDQVQLENAHTVINDSAWAVKQHWKGKAGEAAAATHEALKSNIAAKHSLIGGAFTACRDYRDAHETVKDQARVWVNQLEAARQTINAASEMIKGPKNAPGMAELIEIAARSKAAAVVEEAEALERLTALYEDRVEARDAFRSAIAYLTEEDGGINVKVRAIDNPSPSGPPRRTQGPNEADLGSIRNLIDQANESVWRMVAAWVSGKGPRTFAWDESDPFTQLFVRSDSVAKVKASIQEQILNGNYRDTGRYDAQGEDLPRDLETITSLGGKGNLPEAFMGSFAYDYDVTTVNGDGTATVTIHAWNYTDVESATRIPGTSKAPGGPYYLGPYASMKFVQDVLGGYQTIRQDITWTETVRLP